MVAQGLPIRAGSQWAVDITLRSVLMANGTAKSRAAAENGIVADRARGDKEAAYPEFSSSRRCQLIVVAIETGGRWSAEAAAFLEDLAFVKAREAPCRLRTATAWAWQRRWSRLLATACAIAVAQSLTAPAGTISAGSTDGPAPKLGDLRDRDA